MTTPIEKVRVASAWEFIANSILKDPMKNNKLNLAVNFEANRNRMY